MEDRTAQQASHFMPVQALLEAAIADGAFPGAAWGVAQHGAVRALEGVGRFTYEPGSPRVTPATIYDLASVSKVVATTAMAMLLYQRGILNLDLPLGDVLPGFVVGAERDSGRCRVTIRHLLAHASGLPAHAPLFLNHAHPAGLLRACLRVPLIAEPGTCTEYSDLGFILLGKALEVLASKSIDRFCAREIFSPLGMTNTGYNPAPSSWAAIPPTELDQVFRRRVVQGEVHDENCYILGGCAGHAGLFAPAGDVLRFADAILAPLRSATPPAGTLFLADSVHLFTSRSGLPPGTSRALGWDTPSGSASSSGSYFGLRSIGHLGYTGTSMWIDPGRDLCVVLLTNRTWPTRENKQIQQVRAAFHDLVCNCFRSILTMHVT